jgi:NADH-quinone oxidoreductase subunit C
MAALELAQQLKSRFGDGLSAPVEFRGEQTLEVLDPARLVEVCQFAKAELGFEMLLDISSVDNLGVEPRWTLVYELTGITRHRERLRLKTSVAEAIGEVPSVTGVWKTADWHEREIFDMMGVRFGGHPDLRRILMWDGYPYYPLRKDFPLAGKPSEWPDVAFTQPAPLAGGPFVTAPGVQGAPAREPRARDVGGERA